MSYAARGPLCAMQAKTPTVFCPLSTKLLAPKFKSTSLISLMEEFKAA